MTVFIACLSVLASGTGQAVEPLAIEVNGKPLDFFQPEKTDYVYYLPHGTKEIPAVHVTSGATVFSPDKNGVVTIRAEKTGTGKQRYRIRFEKLPALDLFLCIGQSNMAGRAPMREESGDLEPVPNVYLFTPQGNWVPADNPLNRFSSIRKGMDMQKMGPAYAFAKQVVETTNRPIGLVVNALGGSSIEKWLPGNEHDLYGKSMKRAVEAKPWGTYRAVLWHQGEANSGRANLYPEQLQTLVGQIRTDLDDAKLFFAVGEIAHWKRDAADNEINKDFNTMINGIETFLDDSGVVSAQDLKPIRGDLKDPHFDRESQMILGKRYADLILNKVYETKLSH